MATTYTVVKGDTLSEIAVRYNTTVANLVKLNDITDPDYIVVGQVLTISGSAGSSSKSNSSKAVIKAFGIQSDTDRTMYATWTWTKSNTENYQIIWYYDTGDGVWFIGNDSTVTAKQCTYNAPSNALRVKFKVKPISKKRTVNNKEVSYWTASWSTEKSYSFSNSPPGNTGTPKVEIINKYTLVATLDGLDINAKSVEFQVYKNHTNKFKTGTATIKTGHASWSCTVPVGGIYKVRCRGVRGKIYGDWSKYSENVMTVPAAPRNIDEIRATSESSVYLKWLAVPAIENIPIEYKIEYTDDKTVFESASDDPQSTTTTNNYTNIIGLDTGKEYFFRVKAVNDAGESEWCHMVSVAVGKKPIAPTTWSSTTTAIVGEPVNLYWVHNSEDGSSQSFAYLYTDIDGKVTQRKILNSTDEEEKDKTSVYILDTSTYEEGTQIKWRVQTAGVTGEVGDYSIERVIDVYAPPTLELTVSTDESGETPLETLESFPFYVKGVAGPNTQSPISYHVTVVANDGYESVDNIGNRKFISKGEVIYSKHFDISNEALEFAISAGDIDLENNISYTLTVLVSMNSGLTAESSVDFTVAWTDDIYEPNAEIGIDKESVTASIRPYCEDEDGNLIEDVVLSVYRREYDGKFTELATGIVNTNNTFITDPHPALDLARYRIVAITQSTGAVSYYDVPGVPVEEHAIIIQWDEDWTSFDNLNEDGTEETPWSGSLLRLPYNIDVSDKYSVDAEMVEYIGREHPVSYYGTQLGETSSWNVDIVSTDDETLYALRRLAKWTGDVYVREPSGSGYWASVSVSFSQKHNELTIPVSLDITRVEGGI